MFENTIAQLKSQGLINESDIVIACRDASNVGKAQFWGGAIAAAAVQANAARFILAADEKSIRLFDVNKNTGDYLGSCVQFMKAEIVKAKFGGLGTYTFVIKTATEKHLFQTTKKFYHFYQKEAVKQLKEFIKANY